MRKFERYADPGQVLVGIFTTGLVGIQDTVGRWRPLVRIGEVVIGDYNVKAIIPGPMERFVRSDSAIDTNYKRIPFGTRFFKSRLLDTVAFGEPVRDMKACLSSQ